MTTKRLSIIGLSVLLISLLVAPVAVADDSADGTATAKVISPISIIKVTDLNFGDLVADSTNADTVTIAESDGTRGTSGGYVTLAGGTVTRAKFTTSGESGHAYHVNSITAPLSISDGTNTMDVSNWKAQLAGASYTFGHTANFPASSPYEDTLYIGADLSVGAGQNVATYDKNNTFTVTVEYE